MISFRSFLPSFLLVIGGISAPGTEFLLSVAAEETSVTASRQDVCSQEDMLQTVGDIFGDIGPGQRVWTGNPVPQSQCLQLINYESDDVATYVNQLTSIFGSNFPFCAAEDSDSNTCKAIQAVFDAFVALKEKGCSPIFRNYLPAWNNWYQNSTACVPGSFDTDTKELSNPNGCNAFAVCDILTTVLTLSANQARTGTCGTTAMFTVQSRAGPVRTLQLATELVWTGTTRFLQTAPCPYIYDLFPGIQPLPDPSASINAVCGPNPSGDCQNFYYGHVQGANPESSPAFIQTPGVEFMFTQAFATSYFRHVTGGCTPEGSQLIKPDFSNSDEVEAYQGTYDFALQYYCRGMVDENYSCDLVTDTGPINPWKSLNDVSANFWFSMPYMVPQSADQLKSAFTGELPFDQVSNLNTQRYIEGLFCSINPTGSLTTIDILGEATEASIPVSLAATVPRVSEESLNKMCSEASLNGQGVVVTVNYGPFNDVNNGQTYISIPQPCVTGNEPYCDDGATGTYPICNHVIVLLDCDIEKDQYKFWTWANELTLPKEVLVANETTGIGGSLCSFMVGKPSGGNQPPFEPTPCETGVCNLFCNISDASGTGSAATNTDAEGTDAMGSSSTATTSVSDAGDDPDATIGEVETEVTRPEDGSEDTSSGSETICGCNAALIIACFLTTSVLLSLI